MFLYLETYIFSDIMEDRFKFIALQEAKDFLDGLDKKTRKKVMYNIWKSKTINDKELLKPLHDGIWEFRTLFNQKYIRLFAFWDKGDKKDTLIIGTYGIYKTTSKELKSDIERAKRIRTNYFELKNS